MRRGTSWVWRVPVLLAVAALVLAACGGGEEEGGGGEETKTVKVGMIAPLSGELSSLGLGMRNSADLAIKQANEDNKVEGWRIQFVPEDDTAKPDTGAQVATKLSSDPAVVGVVGTLNSSVATQVQPILSKANVTMISPASTNTTLTQGDDPANKKRPYSNYFRVITTDDIQGRFAATYAFDQAKAKEVVVMHDRKIYGQGLAEVFASEFQKKGGRVLATETVNPDDKDFSAVLSKIRPLEPDLIFFGGEYPAGSLITSQATQQGIRAPIMGGDGMKDEDYLTVAGAAAEGDLISGPADPKSLETGKDFVESYNEADYADDFSAYGAYSYDAARVIVEALAEVLPGKDRIDDSVKREIIEAVQDTDFEGATGKVSFDQFGDATTKVLTIYKVEGGAFKPVETGEFKV